MGSACFKGSKYHKEIERYLSYEIKEKSTIKHLLLLGSGGSGKSTLFKQIKIIHGNGFNNTELNISQNVIKYNMYIGILKLIKKCHQFYGDEFGIIKDNNNDIEMSINYLMNYKNIIVNNTAFNNIDNNELILIGKHIDMLWNLDIIKNKIYCKNKIYFSFPDNMNYFYSKTTKIFDSNYNITVQDALKVRIKTTGLLQKTYIIKDNIFNIYDVGGQRNERRKWIHYFENITSVIYVAALNHYNTVLFEDERKNSMHESIQLFDEIINSKWFKNTEIILFLNKNDLFKQNIRDKHSLSICFDKIHGWEGKQWNKKNDYDPIKNNKGVDNFEYFEYCYNKALSFITTMYLKRNKNNEKVIFTHITTATDTDNVQKVFWDVQNIIIRSNLRKGGLMNI